MSGIAGPGVGPVKGAIYYLQIFFETSWAFLCWFEMDWRKPLGQFVPFQGKRVVAGRSRERHCLNIVQRCPNNPVMGGEYQKTSSHCSERINKLDECATNHHIPVEKVSPDSDDENLLTGCRKARNVNHFHDRILVLVRLCGIISPEYSLLNLLHRHTFTFTFKHLVVV